MTLAQQAPRYLQTAQVAYARGVNVVGAPIRFSEGPVMAAVTVSGPAFRFPKDSIYQTGKLAEKAAAEISRCLGFRG